VYKIDSTTGATTPLTASPFTAGTGPSFLTIDPAGKFLYVCNQTGKTVSKFEINQDTGGIPTSTVATTLQLTPAALVFAK
jgi:6-phosphogluconolactonase (cycloisomerase 2 family)